jgi:hypothetical protein
MEKINFSDCTLAKLERQFGLIPKDTLPSLEAWGSTNFQLPADEERQARKLSYNLFQNAVHWNETDLSMHFIGPMFSLVGFTEKLRFNLFAQRTIFACINDVELTGRVDELIASGYRDPQQPFFAFNEYKRQTDPDGEPAGQAMAAMLVGQALNEDGKPIYGCHIIGRHWFFMILEGKKYAISKAFDGADFEDACQILRILFQLKEYCMERTAHLVID